MEYSRIVSAVAASSSANDDSHTPIACSVVRSVPFSRQNRSVAGLAAGTRDGS